MNYECKQCGASFEKSFGQASCPKCASKNLWTTGGEVKAALVLVTCALVLLLAAYLISPQLFLGVIIGALFLLPVGIWSLFSKRKPSR